MFKIINEINEKKPRFLITFILKIFCYELFYHFSQRLHSFCPFSPIYFYFPCSLPADSSTPDAFPLMFTEIIKLMTCCKLYVVSAEVCLTKISSVLCRVQKWEAYYCYMS
jgi:hypothetical protein